jgi:hypothetical protein
MLRGALATAGIVGVFAATLLFGGRALGVWEEIPAAPAAESSTHGSAPIGWKVHRVPREGFEVALPRGWHVVRPENLRAQLEPGLRTNPELRPLVEAAALRARGSLVKLFAADLTPATLADRARWGTTMNVVVAPAPRPAGADTASLARMFGIPGRVARRTLELPAGKALELRYRWRVRPRPRAVVVTQYLLWRRGRQYVLSFGTPASARETYAPIFRQSAETFRFLPPGRAQVKPAVSRAEARWVRQANALCRRGLREYSRLPEPRTARALERLLERLVPWNERYNAEFLALPAPPEFARELRRLRALFARDERLFAKLLAAARARDRARVVHVMARLTLAGQDESAVMGELGARRCDVYGFGNGS